MALTTTLTGTIQAVLTNSFGGITSTSTRSFNFGDSLADGTALDKADLAWWDEDRTLTGSSNEDLDLAGSLSDAYGSTLTYVKIKCIYVKNKNTAAGDILEIGGAASNAFLLFKDATDIYELGPNGVFLIWEPSAAAHAVTAGTGDLLHINNTSSNSVNYDILIIGTSA